MGEHEFTFIDDEREYYVNVYTISPQRPGHPAKYRTKIYRLVAEKTSWDSFIPPKPEVS